MTEIEYQDDARGFRIILLNRPETRNALNAEVVEGISTALGGASGPVVVLGSSDPAAFSSGADIKLSDAERASVSHSLYALYQEMRASPRIIVVAASGPAVGGGAQLLIASDVRIVSPDVTIRFMGPGHGLVVGAWGLPSLVGRGRAMDLCLSMRTVPAEEALAIGLVDRVVANPLESAVAYAASVAALDRSAVATVKRITSVAAIDNALEAERAHNSSWDGRVSPP